MYLLFFSLVVVSPSPFFENWKREENNEHCFFTTAIYFTHSFFFFPFFSFVFSVFSFTVVACSCQPTRFSSCSGCCVCMCFFFLCVCLCLMECCIRGTVSDTPLTQEIDRVTRISCCHFFLSFLLFFVVVGL